jgi:hypothetical protein
MLCISLRLEFARHSLPDAGHQQACCQAGEEASPDHGDLRVQQALRRITAIR